MSSPSDTPAEAAAEEEDASLVDAAPRFAQAAAQLRQGGASASEFAALCTTLAELLEGEGYCFPERLEAEDKAGLGEAALDAMVQHADCADALVGACTLLEQLRLSGCDAWMQPQERWLGIWCAAARTHTTCGTLQTAVFDVLGFVLARLWDDDDAETRTRVADDLLTAALDAGACDAAIAALHVHPNDKKVAWSGLELLSRFLSPDCAGRMQAGAWDAALQALDLFDAEKEVQRRALWLLRGLVSSLPESARDTAKEAATYKSVVRVMLRHPNHGLVWADGIHVLDALAKHAVAAVNLEEAVRLTDHASHTWRSDFWVQKATVNALTSLLAHPSAAQHCRCTVVLQDAVAAMRKQLVNLVAWHVSCCSLFAVMLNSGAASHEELVEAGAPSAVVAALRAFPSADALQRDGLALLSLCLGACGSDMPMWAESAAESGPQVFEAACAVLKEHPGVEALLEICLACMAHTVADSQRLAWVRVPSDLVRFSVTTATDALRTSMGEAVLIYAARLLECIVRRLPEELRQQAELEACRSLVPHLLQTQQRHGMSTGFCRALNSLTNTRSGAAAAWEAGAIEAVAATVRRHASEDMLRLHILELLASPNGLATVSGLTQAQVTDLLSIARAALSGVPLDAYNVPLGSRAMRLLAPWMQTAGHNETALCAVASLMSSVTASNTPSRFEVDDCAALQDVVLCCVPHGSEPVGVTAGHEAAITALAKTLHKRKSSSQLSLSEAACSLHALAALSDAHRALAASKLCIEVLVGVLRRASTCMAGATIGALAGAAIGALGCLVAYGPNRERALRAGAPVALLAWLQPPSPRDLSGRAYDRGCAALASLMLQNDDGVQRFDTDLCARIMRALPQVQPRGAKAGYARLQEALELCLQQQREMEARAAAAAEAAASALLAEEAAGATARAVAAERKSKKKRDQAARRNAPVADAGAPSAQRSEGGSGATAGGVAEAVGVDDGASSSHAATTAVAPQPAAEMLLVPPLWGRSALPLDSTPPAAAHLAPEIPAPPLLPAALAHPPPPALPPLPSLPSQPVAAWPPLRAAQQPRSAPRRYEPPSGAAPAGATQASSLLPPPMPPPPVAAPPHVRAPTSVRQVDESSLAGVVAVLSDENATLAKELKAALAALAALEEEHTCTVCLDAPRCAVLLPCRHLAICGAPACAAMLGTPRLCPVCRNPATDTMTVFTC
jgi:hypothetical protein